MVSAKRNLFFLKRRMTALLMAFIMIWLISPLEAFASTDLEVTELHLKQIRKDDGDYAGIDIRGQNLEGARLFFNTVELSKIPNVKIIQNNPFRYEVEYKIGNGNDFPINTLTNSVQSVRIVSGVQETKNFDFTLNIDEKPSLDPTDTRIFLNQAFKVTGEFLGLDTDKARRRIILGGFENNISTISDDGRSASVLSLQGPAGNPVDLGYKVYGVDQKTSYSFILFRAVTPVNKIPGLDNLSVIPNKGPISGGTILTINAKNASGSIIEGANLFNDKMQVWLRKSTEPNKGKEVQATVELIQKNGFNIGLLATTPEVKKNQQVDDTGFYDVVIKQGTGVTSSEAVEKEAFLYVEEGNPLILAYVNPSKAKDTVPTQIQVVGQNIFYPAGIGYSGQGATVEVEDTVTVEEEGGVSYLEVTYKITGTAKYGNETIKSITRKISLRIGDIAAPLVKDDLNQELKIQNTPSENNHYSTKNGDGILFKTPSITTITRPKYDVILETSTIITVEDGASGRPLPEIKERATLKDYFEYEPTTVRPTITKIEPVHGYYNDVNATEKPLWIRITGTNFQVVKTEDPINPIKYPEITLRRNDGVTLNPFNNIQAEVVKVLKGTESVDGEFTKFGDTMVVKLYPKTNGYKLSDFILSASGNDGQGYKWVPARFYISQDSGHNQGTILTSPFLEWRYPTGSRENQLQPKIEQVLYNGSSATVLSSDRENELEIRFTANALNDLSSVKVTIDGMDISNKIKERKFEEDVAVIKVMTPKGLNGDTSIQVIIKEGLMDSYDNISFSPVTGPILKEIVPNRGQAGTYVVIKRDTAANNIRFIKPTSTPDTGTRVLVDGVIVDGTIADAFYEVKDSDTIIFRIPTGAELGNRIIQVQNPDRSRSQGLSFRVADVGGSVTKIASIKPDRGDWKGGISATIKAQEGTSFTGEVDVYFGSQKATVTGYNLNFTEVYIKVPAFKENIIRQGETYKVPVTVVNKQNLSSDTLLDGYTYIYPAYDIAIQNIYKEGMASDDPNRNKGVAGDEVWIEGVEFRGKIVDSNLILPSIYFGNTEITQDGIVDYQESTDTSGGTDIRKLLRIKVKVPAKPQTSAQDGSVTVMLINPDGATAIKDKGFIYSSGTPQILKESSTLTASRFYDTINVFGKDIVQSGLIVAFGDKNYTVDIANAQKDLLLDKEQEKIIVRFIPGSGDNVQLLYIDPDKPSGENLIPIDDLYEYKNGTKIPITDGKLRVELGEQKLVGIKWNNPDYHKAIPITNQELLEKLNDELISIKIDRKASRTINELKVRRGLGIVENFQLNKVTNVANIRIKTPYNDRPEKTKIYLINSDSSQASADFEFLGGTETPTITAVAGTKDRKITINNAQQTSKVFTQDVNLDSGVIKIEGQNLKNIQAVRIGGTLLTIDAVSPDGTWILAKVKKGTPELVGVPQVISVTTTSGTALSDAATDVAQKIYFMYISPGTSPKITTVAPDNGITTGGNILRITGEGFSNKDEFGVEPGSTTTYQITVNINGADAGIRALEKDAAGNILAMTVSAPKGDPGKATLTVINGDGGSATAPFNYISQPKITSANTSTGVPIMFNDEDSEITLIGEEFQTGAKIFIGATVADKKTDEAIKVAGIKGLTVSGTNKEVYVLGGYEATGVTFVNSKTIKFKMPSGIMDLDNKSIIIVNPDTGVSDGFEDGTIKPPVPDVPDIEAIPGFERTMILRWTVDKDVLNAAEKFEIYVRERRSGDYTFVGDTKQDTTEQSYVIKGLKYDTTYDILVRVLNKYGEAEDFGSVRETTLKQNQDYKEKEKVEAVDKAVTQIETQGKQEVIGDTLYYTVGTRESTINLSNTTAKNKTKYVQIPVRDIKAGSKTITITDKDLSLTVSYSSLNTPELRNVPDDAVFRFKISAAEKQIEEGLTRAIPRVYKKASNVYGIYFELAQPKLVTPIAMLSGSATININAPAYPKYHAVYIESADTFSILQSNIITQGGNYVLLTNK